MTTILTASARRRRPVNLDTLVERVTRTKKPLQIRTPNSTCVLITVEDWRGIQETLYLKSIPGVWESIEEGKKAVHEECFSLEELGWTIK